MTEPPASQVVADCRAACAALARRHPQPQTELHYGSHFELLIAVILSAQTTDIRVNQVTSTLFQIANTPEAMCQLGLESLEQHIQSVGLYHSKARHIMQTSALLIQRHGGRVPNQRQALQALPGVGRKTASVVLNAAFGQPTIAVDTHVLRVSNRTGLARGKTPLAVERQWLHIAEYLPHKQRRHIHSWLVLHGRYVCTARRPQCGQCVISRWCQYTHKEEP